MQELYQKKYLEIIKRFDEQKIDIIDKHIMIDNSLDGEPISGYSISDDKRWVCVPIYDDEWSSFAGKYEYKPQCFEIEEMYTTYLDNGCMSFLTQVIVLKRQ